MEDLDAVVEAVGHGHDPAGAEVDAGGRIKLAGVSLASDMAVGFHCSEMVCERAVGMEDLDAVVEAVGHGHGSVGAEGYVVGAVERTRAIAPPRRSEPIVERAVGVEDLDGIGAVVGHGHDPAGAEGCMDRNYKFGRGQFIRLKLKGKYRPFRAWRPPPS